MRGSEPVTLESTNAQQCFAPSLCYSVKLIDHDKATDATYPSLSLLQGIQDELTRTPLAAGCFISPQLSLRAIPQVELPG